MRVLTGPSTRTPKVVLQLRRAVPWSPVTSDVRPQSSFARMTTRLTADVAVHEYLRILEREMNLFGSALPQNKDRPAHHLTVKEVEEYDFGWVYFYNSKEFVETGNFDSSLVGNAPVIVDRHDGKLYGTGTSRPIEHYLREFREGIRHALQMPHH